MRRKIIGMLAVLVTTGMIGSGHIAMAQTSPAPAPPAPQSAPAMTPPAATPAVTPPATTPPPAIVATAPAPNPPVAPPAAPDMTKTDVPNPYGLGALWDSGDIIARATLLILVIMSMGSWYVLITKAFTQARIFGDAKKVEKTFWSAGSVRAATDAMKPGTAFKFIAESGLESLDKHIGLLGKIDIASFATSSIDDGVTMVQSRMQDGLALLGTVGATAPFVGLFGTVWGIYHALTAIGIAGQASIDTVAGPVGESLIMTAIGLAVAVPAVLGYNFLVRRNKRAMDLVRRFAKKMLFVLLSSDASEQSAHLMTVHSTAAVERV